MESFPALVIHPEIKQALKNHSPVVALETSVITHGLPHSQNLQLARNVQKVIREQHAIPATVALLNGKICVGLDDTELEYLSTYNEVHKISAKDFAIGINQDWTGGTTVAATLVAAQLAGISVFTTGGIGGVHRGNPYDISADLQLLAQTSIIVVCTGAKAILDLPATLEYLETLSVPVIGFRTLEFPAFYTKKSGLQVNFAASSPAEIAEIAFTHWNHLHRTSAVLVTNPPPEDIDIGYEKIEEEIQKAILDARKSSIHGTALTPYLLQRLNELTSGSSLKTNLSLLLSNAELAAQIAVAFAKIKSTKI